MLFYLYLFFNSIVTIIIIKYLEMTHFSIFKVIIILVFQVNRESIIILPKYSVLFVTWLYEFKKYTAFLVFHPLLAGKYFLNFTGHNNKISWHLIFCFLLSTRFYWHIFLHIFWLLIKSHILRFSACYAIFLYTFSVSNG